LTEHHGFQPIEFGPFAGFIHPTQVLVAREPHPIDPLDGPRALEEPPRPSVRRLYVNASQRCNLRCTYCFAEHGDRYDGAPDMDPDLARRAVDLALQNLAPGPPVFRLVFFGGEPWLAFDLCLDLLDYTARALSRRHPGAELSALFVTNFTLPTEAQFQRMAGLPIDISVSVDGGQEAHDRYRVFADGRGTWANITERLRRLRHMAPGALSAICTVTPENLDLVATVPEILGMGFDQLCVRHVFCPDTRINLGGGAVHRLIDAYARAAEVNLARALRDEPAEFEIFRVHFEILHHRLLARYPCGAGREWFTLTTSGALYPCPEFAPQRSMGTVDDGFDVDAVARFAAHTGVREGRPCEGCRARAFCRGGCSAEALHLAGNHEATIELRCTLARAIGDLAAGLYLELRERRPELLERYVGYARSGLAVDRWPPRSDRD